jgi:predicted RecB family nuclease
MTTGKPSNLLKVTPSIQGPSPAITRDILEAYLNCKYKGYLRLAGQTGMSSAYEVLMQEIRVETLKKAEAKLSARYGGGEPLRGVRIDFACLKQGVPLILDGLIQDDGLSLRVDGLIRIDGPSRLGNFQYVPVLIHEREKIGPEQRHLLTILGLLIGDVQGKQPSYGVIVLGRSLKIGKVDFNVRSRSARRLLDGIRGLASATSPPRLILNDHCQVCEFRQACEQQAINEDNLSLIRGIGEKGVKSYSRRGIFTITQLAHTFRPRRKRTSPERISTHRYHALSALAIRDHAVYIIARPPAFPDVARAYFDVESDPDEGYVYLIGLVVIHGGQEHRCSFWADAKEEESRIFELFLDELERLGQFTLFCYGSFEKTFLKRMRKWTTRTEVVDRAISSLINILSVIYTHFYFCTYSNGLKDIGRLLGFEWTENASAIQSIVWHLRWQRSNDDRWKEKILTYNTEDCLALMRVALFIEDIAAGVKADQPCSGSKAGSAKLTFVEDVDRSRATRLWGLNKYPEGLAVGLHGCLGDGLLLGLRLARLPPAEMPRPPHEGSERSPPAQPVRR